MVKDKQAPVNGSDISRGFAWPDIAAAVLGYAGLVVASTVWWADRINADLPCMAGGGCEQVAASVWSHVHVAGFDIPVALLGVAGYFILFTLSILRFGMPSARRALLLASTAISAGGTLYSWYLQYVAHVKIGAFCPWCFTSACVMTLFLVVSIAAMTSPSPGVDVADSEDSRGKKARKIAAERRRKLMAAWALPIVVIPLFVSVLAVRRHVDAIAPPTIGTVTSAPPTASTPNSEPASIDIDFPTWVRILEHTDSQPRGADRTPYTLIEIGDFQCPTCAKVRPSIEDIVDHDRVNMFFINFPLRMHKWGVPASEAAFAAAEQGKFWPMYDALYSHQSDLEPSKYAEYAQAAGLDGSRLGAEVASHKFLSKVKASIAFCNSIKVVATPTLIIHNNMNGSAFVAVGSAQIATAIDTTDWHQYDDVNLDQPAPAASPGKKKHRHT